MACWQQLTFRTAECRWTLARHLGTYVDAHSTSDEQLISKTTTVCCDFLPRVEAVRNPRGLWPVGDGGTAWFGPAITNSYRSPRSRN